LPARRHKLPPIPGHHLLGYQGTYRDSTPVTLSAFAMVPARGHPPPLLPLGVGSFFRRVRQRGRLNSESRKRTTEVVASCCSSASIAVPPRTRQSGRLSPCSACHRFLLVTFWRVAPVVSDGGWMAVSPPLCVPELRGASRFGSSARLGAPT